MTWNSLPNLAHEQLVTETHMDQLRENIEHLGSMQVGVTALSAVAAGSRLGGSGFLVRKTATQSTTGTVTTKVTWDAEDYDADNAFDLSNERYTVPNTGRYLFNYRLSAANDSAITFVAIYLNGAEVYRFNGAYGSATGSITLNLAASDYVELFIQQSSTQNINSANNVTWWSGVKVGLA
jgi:hypothetical protein